MPGRDDCFSSDTTTRRWGPLREFTRCWRGFPQQVFSVPTLVWSLSLMRKTPN